MLDVTAGAWAATIGFVVVLFAIDLLYSGRRPHAVGFREAVGWSVFYIAVALLFGVVFGVLAGSVDNVFVFVIIMSAFAVRAEHQQRVTSPPSSCSATTARSLDRRQRPVPTVPDREHADLLA